MSLEEKLKKLEGLTIDKITVGKHAILIEAGDEFGIAVDRPIRTYEFDKEEDTQDE